MRMMGRGYTLVLVARETWGEGMGRVRPGKWLQAHAFATYTHRWYDALCKIVQFRGVMLLFTTATQADQNHH